ncbi:MAG: cell division protein ZapD, partial [Gammaproteobacteria bacterium]
VQTSVEVILRLSRETSQFQTVSVDDGYYEEEMTRDQYRFIAINLPGQSHLFPEVSTGPTRFSIHFKQLTARLTSEKFEGQVDFSIAKYR